MGRIVEKTELEYGGDYTKVLDVVRASGIFESASHLADLIERLGAAAGVTVVRVKDRFNYPASGGYRDLLLNVRVGGIGHVAELQLHLGPLVAMKPRSHRVHRVLRSFGGNRCHLDQPVRRQQQDRQPQADRQQHLCGACQATTNGSSAC